MTSATTPAADSTSSSTSSTGRAATDTGTSTRVTVISNPASGSAISDDELRESIENAAGSWSISWSPTTPDDPGVGQARAAAESAADRVVACGGDGTVRAVLESVAGTNTSLGIVPLGTGNLLASNLGIAAGLDAVPVAFGTTTGRTLDVGVVNGERFAVMAGIGFDALMIRDANPKMKRRFGSVAYVWSAARHIRRSRFGAMLTIDGAAAWTGHSAMILVGNCGAVTGGLEVFPDADPDDGVLDVAVLSVSSPREWASVMWRMLRSKNQRADLVTRFTGTSVVVDVETPQPYELDGEDRDPIRHLEFSIEPDALQVATP